MDIAAACTSSSVACCLPQGCQLPVSTFPAQPPPTHRPPVTCHLMPPCLLPPVPPVPTAAGEEDAKVFCAHYYVKPEGNCDLSRRSDPHGEFTGLNVLIARQVSGGGPECEKGALRAGAPSRQLAAAPALHACLPNGKPQRIPSQPHGGSACCLVPGAAEPGGDRPAGGQERGGDVSPAGRLPRAAVRGEAEAPPPPPR